MSSEKTHAKPQPTLRGYAAWAFNGLVRMKGTGEGPVAAWIIDRWVDENGAFLEREFGISRKAFELERAGGQLVQHPSSKQGSK